MSDAEDILNDSPKDTTSSPSQRSSESQGSTPDEASPSHKESAVSLQEQRNKRSSVYVYLAVLFGAAFLMLLLAYLVQQRNNASVLSDLRTTTASREELLESIRLLEEEIVDLQNDKAKLEGSTSTAEEQNQALQQRIDEYQSQMDARTRQLEIVNTLWYLERFCNEQDFLMAACVVEDCDRLYNDLEPDFQKEGNYLLPGQTSRYKELRDRLEENGYVLVVRTIEADGSVSSEDAAVAQALAAELDEDTSRTIDTARSLWKILFHYPHQSDIAAQSMVEFCAPESGNVERLTGEAFQDSTLVLLEQIKAELIASGELTQGPDGVISKSRAADPS